MNSSMRFRITALPLLRRVILAVSVAGALANSALADCTSAANRFVHSTTDLRLHEEIHALNVRELMIRTALRFPSTYIDVLPYIVELGADHDVPKSIMRHLIALCKIYGENLEIRPEMSPEHKAEIQKLRQSITELNNDEKALKRATRIRLGLLTPEGSPTSNKAQQILERIDELENISDITERVANAISPEELGKPAMNVENSLKYLASKSSARRTEQMRMEARTMIKHYKSQPAYTAHIEDFQRARNGNRALVLSRNKATAEARFQKAVHDLDHQLKNLFRIPKLPAGPSAEADPWFRRNLKSCPESFRLIQPAH